MKTVCFYFQVHPPWRLKTYRFFQMGNDHNYLDDFTNRAIMQKVARECYLPMNALLLNLINEHKGAVRCTFSITGSAVEQFKAYAPEVLESFKRRAEPGCVEFLAETYSHSLSSLYSVEDFKQEVKLHTQMLKDEFGVKPTAFRNTELIYSDEIAAMVASMGFKGIITEGAKHILGWKSPNYLYTPATAPKVKLMLKNYKLSDDITFRFSNYAWNEYPLTADKFMGWIGSLPEGEEVVNLFMTYDTLGELQSAETGIFGFMKALPRFAAEKGITFSTPSEVIAKLKPVDVISVNDPISWADEERDTSAWLGNILQKEAFEKLYSVAERVRLCSDTRLKQDWNYLQASDHFYYMCTKHFADGAVHSHYSPYDSAYEAFTNYMNVLSDFIVRVEEQFPATIENEELNALITTIRNQAAEIEVLKKELASAKANAGEVAEEKPAKKAPAKKKAAPKAEPKEEAPVAEEKPAKKAPAKKTTKKAEK